jgi:hypothetical protein
MHKEEQKRTTIETELTKRLNSLGKALEFDDSSCGKNGEHDAGYDLGEKNRPRFLKIRYLILKNTTKFVCRAFPLKWHDSVAGPRNNDSDSSMLVALQL